MKKGKVRIDRVVIIVLALIGLYTVGDNAWRISKELGNSAVHAIKNHRWNTYILPEVQKENNQKNNSVKS